MVVYSSASMGLTSRTIEQKTNNLGFPKPGEVVEMTGTHALEASDRAIQNLLYQHAHDSGRLLDPTLNGKYLSPSTRQSISKHESTDRLQESLDRLMHVMVNVVYVANEDRDYGQGPEQRVVITGLFDFFDMSAKELAKSATFLYGLPRKLAPILKNSGRWGRIKAEVVCSMTSKYAIALYELIQFQANLDNSVKVFPLIGSATYSPYRQENIRAATTSMRKVIDPALLQVNGLSDMGVRIALGRLHSRAPVNAILSPGGANPATNSGLLCRSATAAKSAAWRVCAAKSTSYRAC